MALDTPAPAPPEKHEPPDEKPRRFAVVAVHGVAYHPPGEMARLVADLLLKPEHTPNSVTYSPYDETNLRIPVGPINVPTKDDDDDRDSPKRGRFDERSTFVRAMQHAHPAKMRSEDVSNDDRNSFGFMRNQLRHYRPRNDDMVYETLRLRTTRVESGAGAEVHIFEMRWSDLSTLGKGALRVLGELYQLLFHLASLGRQTADFAWIASKGHAQPWWWKSLRFCVAWAARMLTLPIPIFNLLLLSVVLMPLPGYFLSEVADQASVAIAGVAAGILAVMALMRFRGVPWILWFLAPPVVVVAAGFAALIAIQPRAMKFLPFGGFQLLALEYCVVAAIVLAVVMAAFERRRPGAAFVALWLGTPTFLFGVLPAVLIAPNTWTGILLAAIKVVEILFFFLLASWFVMIAFTWLAAITAFFAVHLSPGRQTAEQSRSVRAAQTACLALSAPAVLGLVTTLVFYRALNQTAEYVFPDLPYFPSQLLVDFFDFPVEMQARDFLNSLIVASGTPAFVVSLLMLLSAIVLLVWAVLPVAISDFRPPKKTLFRSEALGGWLSNGYRLLNGVGIAFFLAYPVALTFGLIAQLLNRHYGFLPIDSSTREVLAWMGALVFGSVGGLLAFGGQLEKLTFGFRPFLNILLDVDNHLREHPLNDNPRARISCRFASLLRYLSEWRDPRDDGGYTGLIIVAHSQGTVISAELLRFLHEYRKEQEAELRRVGTDLPVYLFTMGCPLRQLYGWRFPHLFAWARHNDEDLPTAVDPPAIPGDRKPDPKKLGVQVWVNAFRSGDYIGRHLWRSDSCAYQYSNVVSEDAIGLRREFCIGAGGHIHYFDDTAPEIAAELDRLIARISGKKSPASAAGEEVAEADEETLVKSIVQTSLQLLNEHQRPVRRGQHPKQHACLKALFEIASDIPAELKVGIFSKPEKYPAVIRFSNGREFDDTHSDIHGMAIKLSEVPGKKLLEGDADATTQDFVLIDNPVFFIRNLTDYAPFSRLVLKLKQSWRFVAVGRLAWFFIERGQWRQFRILMQSRGKRINSPLTTQYWSTTPYRLGDSAAVKYSACPSKNATRPPPTSADPNYLHQAVIEGLSVEPEICFDFSIQLHGNPLREPIEDPTVEWTTDWTKVATIRIPQQNVDDPELCRRCENLSFTPWHSLPEHRPLGGVNRVRKAVYAALSARRHELNKADNNEG